MVNRICREQLYACAGWSQWGIRSQSCTYQRSEVLGAFEGASETQESDVPLDAPLPEPKAIGALLLGIQGDRWPRRRWVLGTQIFCMQSLASDWAEGFLPWQCTGAGHTCSSEMDQSTDYWRACAPHTLHCMQSETSSTWHTACMMLWPQYLSLWVQPVCWWVTSAHSPALPHVAGMLISWQHCWGRCWRRLLARL